MHQAMIDRVIAIRELELTHGEVTVLFPSERLATDAVDDKIVEVTLFVKPARTMEVRRRLATALGEIVKNDYPKAKVEVFVHTFHHNEEAFWSSEG